MEHYQEIIERFQQLGQLHDEIAELLARAPDPKYAENDHTLAEAENATAKTCFRVAETIRRRLEVLSRPKRGPRDKRRIS